MLPFSASIFSNASILYLISLGSAFLCLPVCLSTYLPACLPTYVSLLTESLQNPV